jgi:hypothetical protein
VSEKWPYAATTGPVIKGPIFVLAHIGPLTLTLSPISGGEGFCPSILLGTVSLSNRSGP